MDEYEEESQPRGWKPFILKVSRFFIQLFFFILFGNLFFIFGYNFFGAIANLNGLPLPVMQSYATPGTTIVGAYDLFMESLSHGVFPFLAFGILLIFGSIIGRATCGWICPFGFILDLCYSIPVQKRVAGYQINQQLSKVKFFILGLTFFVAISIGIVVAGGGTPLPLGPFTQNAFAPIDPATTFQAVIPQIFVNSDLWPSLEAGVWQFFAQFEPWFWFRVLFMVIFLLVSMYIGRAWCRWFCPLGAMLGLMTPHAIVGVQRNPSKCLGKKCRECEIACPMGVPLLREPWEKIRDKNCIMCLKCYEACDEGAITLTFFKFTSS